MKDIPDGSVNLVLCDLPYGITKNKWDSVIPLDDLWEQYKRVSAPRAVIALFGQGMFTAKVMMSNPKMWRYNLVWKKGERTSGFLNANRQPMRNHEDIIIFSYPKSTYNPQMVYSGLHNVNHGIGNCENMRTNNLYGNFKDLPSRKSEYKFPKSVINIQPEHKEFFHPTQKPVKLLEWLIKSYSNEGDTVLDNTMGSGSTGVAAVNSGRNFIGIELDEKYFQIAQQRIEQAQNEPKQESMGI